MGRIRLHNHPVIYSHGCSVTAAQAFCKAPVFPPEIVKGLKHKRETSGFLLVETGTNKTFVKHVGKGDPLS